MALVETEKLSVLTDSYDCTVETDGYIKYVILGKCVASLMQNHS